MRLIVTLLLLTALATNAQEKTLRWKSLDVTARIDRDGMVTVSERHRMLFNGDWNGGERSFRVGPGQIFRFLQISRVDPGSGQLIPLTEAADSIGLHQYRLDHHRLRWRARLEHDPPFRNRELTYVIDYALMNVIVKEGDLYSLDHDFAFPDRQGVIESYSLNLELDPVWKAPEGFETRIERSMIPPGESVIVDIPLTWTGEGQPAYLGVDPSAYAVQPAQEEAPSPPPPPAVAMPLRIAALVAFLLLLLGLRLWFIRREERIGRYAPPPDVDRLWLERNLLAMKPEVVGTAWDDTTGEAEVAALIARMAMEGKIENLPGKEPRLKLLVPRESLEGYEWEFVDAMFIAGDEITPKQLKKQYAATGFDPVTPLRAPLQKAAGQIVGNAKFGSGCAAVVIGSLLIAALAPGTFARIAGVVAFLISAGLASVYRTQLGGKTAASFLTFPLALFGMLVVVNAGSAIALAAALLATLVLAGLVFFVGAWTATREELDMLLRLRAAREWLRSLLNLLGTKQPEIEERWVPYILAFGLGQQLDQWSVAAPAPPASTSHPRRSTSTSIDDSSPSGPTFKAGGGAFGGAGATGGWAQSVASFAAAVPKPGPPPGSGSSSSRSSWSSSSSSRSSSSSSSSRSGGGGGGGW